METTAVVDESTARRGQLVAQQLILRARALGELAVDPPSDVAPDIWVCEHFRLLLTDLNILVGLLCSSGACTALSCPQMCCGSQQYLCAPHSAPRECCAPDYMVHTLDAATSALTSSREFSSRLVLRPGLAASVFPNQARRLYRIMSHAWRHHAPLFSEFEASTRTAARFTALARTHRLLSADQFLIPDAAVEAAGASFSAAAPASGPIAARGAGPSISVAATPSTT